MFSFEDRERIRKVCTDIVYNYNYNYNQFLVKFITIKNFIYIFTNIIYCTMNIKIIVNINIDKNISKQQKNYNNIVKPTFKQAYDNLRLIKLKNQLSQISKFLIPQFVKNINK